MQKPIVLLIDDDPLITESMGFILKKHFQIVTAESRVEARNLLAKLDKKPELALVDLGLPPLPHDPDEGFALIEDLLAHDSQMKILVLSGQSDEANMHHALTLGAVDFIPKPADPELLQSRLNHQLMLKQVESKSEPVNDTSAIIGDSASVSALREQITQFADTIFPVLIEGESGTGKELVATALHQQSKRADKPYLVINCAAIAPELLESQLFGHSKGAFTGADKSHKGFFEEAGEGTLFLDEIGEMAYDLQAKLLRVLESGEFHRIGETQCIKSKARIIAATNKSLQHEVTEGHFRSDLFHRLSILKIQMPPVRERENDSLLLLQHFLQFYADSVKPVKLNDDAELSWKAYDFPGNVRELRNIVIRLCTKFPGQTINHIQLQQEFEQNLISENTDDSEQNLFSSKLIQQQIASGELNLNLKLKELEEFVIQQAMQLYKGNLSKVAKALQINRTTLYSRMQKKQ
ncbi:MAG: sigma-54-dependent Fis family transcriptional regulator [endosymbiont of Galathealinum brachiosum]|uniref:Sigma-54-dependent Fis family transcriptional regulator n=1 Tax=endosymbiont of Galathealinum brachiosum TaxID=2200906 RepID=A0A370DF21_9GAMM|nr:MAG: sigma-54-dependent Fis family transcriptional regulator [endosymbiont of Galathealinum brachiosum]